MQSVADGMIGTHLCIVHQVIASHWMCFRDQSMVLTMKSSSNHKYTNKARCIDGFPLRDNKGLGHLIAIRQRTQYVSKQLTIHSMLQNRVLQKQTNTLICTRSTRMGH